MSKICGVEDIETASVQSLERLLRQFGRNGPMSETQQAKYDEIVRRIAEKRGEVGFEKGTDGAIDHHPV